MQSTSPLSRTRFEVAHRPEGQLRDFWTLHRTWVILAASLTFPLLGYSIGLTLGQQISPVIGPYHWKPILQDLVPMGIAIGVGLHLRRLGLAALIQLAFNLGQWAVVTFGNHASLQMWRPVLMSLSTLVIGPALVYCALFDLDLAFNRPRSGRVKPVRSAKGSGPSRR